MDLLHWQQVGRRVAEIHGLPLYRIIEKYNQKSDNPGACDHRRGEVRIKLSGNEAEDRYVLCHELAHLIHAHHEVDFHLLTSALIGTAMELEHEQRISQRYDLDS